MVTLTLVVCLSSMPNICHEEHPPVDVLSTTACMIQGQQIAAEWTEQHPKWQVTGWRCQFGPRQKQT